MSVLFTYRKPTQWHQNNDNNNNKIFIRVPRFQIKW